MVEITELAASIVRAGKSKALRGSGKGRKRRTAGQHAMGRVHRFEARDRAADTFGRNHVAATAGAGVEWKLLLRWEDTAGVSTRQLPATGSSASPWSKCRRP